MKTEMSGGGLFIVVARSVPSHSAEERSPRFDVKRRRFPSGHRMFSCNRNMTFLQSLPRPAAELLFPGQVRFGHVLPAGGGRLPAARVGLANGRGDRHGLLRLFSTIYAFGVLPIGE